MADDDRGPEGGDNTATPEEAALASSWALMKRLAGPRVVTPEAATAKRYPGELVIATETAVLCRIQPTGNIIYEDGYTPDEAAEGLFMAIARKRVDYDLRMQYLNMLELHIALLAVSDAAYEAAQRAARFNEQEPAPYLLDALRQREERSRASLEMRVHGIIEFAREFANIRPDLVAQARGMVPGAQPSTPAVPVQPVPAGPLVEEVCICERIRSMDNDGAVIEVVRSPACQAHRSSPS
jgi:hypothetical protein